MSFRKITIKSGNEESTLEVTEEEYQKYYRPWWQQKKHEQRNREAMEQNGYTEESYEAWRDNASEGAGIPDILENEKYKGDALLQKYYTSDFLSKKSVRNMGQIEQVYVKDSHPPIVDKELWEAVQLEIERRRLFREKHNLQNMGRYTDVQPFTCRVICGKCGAVYWRRTWTRGSRKIRVWQCGKRYRQKGVAGCKSGNLYEKDLEKAFLMAWNGIVENRESFLPAWKKQITEGNALEKWRAGQMVQLTAEPPLETICPEIVNMVLESVEVHDGGLLHFHFLDGTELEIETEE